MSADALSPLTVTLGAMGSLPGLANPLIVGSSPGWTPASSLGLDELLGAAHRRWTAAPHAAATLAWKSYTYWVAMPAVLGWACCRRVPVVDADNVMVKLGPGTPLLTIGLRTGASIGLAAVDHNEEALLRALRASLMEDHLDPLASRISDEVNVGRRTLLGSVASGIAYAVVRAGHLLPGDTTDTVTTLLKALELDDLVDLVPGAGGEPEVRRRTCCLAFTLPEPKICRGCCLRHT
jgi:ferric iron reductase protein FhuF